MKMTLLEIVQNILAAMESDEVNSIGDTVESLQVAEEVRTAYEDLFSNYDWPSERKLVSLAPSNDPDRPTQMTIPSDVDEVYSIHYNHGTLEAPEFVEVRFREPELFFRYATIYMSQSEPSMLVDNFYVFTNNGPRYWTTYDNNTILFDSYNSSLDSTLQESKVLCWARKSNAFQLNDDFVAPIDEAHFPLLLSEAKRMSFVNYKGVSNANEERRNRGQRVRLQKHLWKARQRQPFEQVDYSRKRR